MREKRKRRFSNRNGVFSVIVSTACVNLNEASLSVSCALEMKSRERRRVSIWRLGDANFALRLKRDEN